MVEVRTDGKGGYPCSQGFSLSNDVHRHLCESQQPVFACVVTGSAKRHHLREVLASEKSIGSHLRVSGCSSADETRSPQGSMVECPSLEHGRVGRLVFQLEDWVWRNNHLDISACQTSPAQKKAKGSRDGIEPPSCLYRTHMLYHCTTGTSVGRHGNYECNHHAFPSGLLASAHFRFMRPEKPPALTRAHRRPLSRKAMYR